MRIAACTLPDGKVTLENQFFGRFSDAELAAAVDEHRFNALVERYYAEKRDFEPAMTERIQQRRLSEIEYVLGKLVGVLETIDETWRRYAVVPPFLAVLYEKPSPIESEEAENEPWLIEASVIARAGDAVVYYETLWESFECGRLTGERFTWADGAVDVLLDGPDDTVSELRPIQLALDRACNPGRYPS